MAARHPAEKGLLAVLTLGACLAAQAWWIPLIVFGLMAALTVWAGRTPWLLYGRLLLVPVAFLLLGLPAVALSVSTGPVPDGRWFEIFGLYVGATQAGLGMARDILVRMLGAVSCLYFLALSTPLPDLLGLLRRCRVPALFLEILMLVYRFVFVLLDTALEMRRAQTLRLGYTGLGTSYRAWGGLLANLLLRAYQRAGGLYTALTLRGYDGNLRVLETPRRMYPGNVVLAALLGGSLLLLAVTV
ncbi:MAG: cobalt ECF transporter T component CbiQ [Candidatus Desulforudaceae bacterium]